MVFALAASVAPSAQIGRNTIAASEWLELAVEAIPPHARQLLRLHARADHHHVLITVSDHGSWHTPPPHPGYRGRG